MRTGIIVAGVLALGLCGCRPAADGQGKAELVADVESIQPGTPFMAGFLITLPKGWHTYWRNPGDSGMAPELKWQLPDGFTTGPVLWPAPKRFEDSSVVSFGYDRQVLLLQEIRPPADLAVDREYTLEVNALWLVCKDTCETRTGRKVLTLRALAGPAAPSARWRELFARTRAEVPLHDPAWTFRAVADDKVVSLFAAPPRDVDSMRVARSTFFPSVPNLVEYGEGAWKRAGDGYRLGMKRVSGGGPLPGRLQGVLVPPGGKGAGAIEVDVAIESKKRKGNHENENADGGCVSGGGVGVHRVCRRYRSQPAGAGLHAEGHAGN